MRNIKRDFLTDHHLCEFVRIGVLCSNVTDILSLSQNSNAVGHIHDLMQLVRDDNHGLAVCLHVAHDVKETIRLLRRQNGSRLIENQNVCSAIENFYNLNSLFLRDRHVIYFLTGIYDKSVFVAYFLDVCRHGLNVKFGILGTERYILSCRKYIYKFKMLMDHTDSAVERVFR